MSRFKLRALMGASALVAASALALGANAQTLQGGGSSLLAPTWANLTGCWDTDSSQSAPDLNGSFLNKAATGVDSLVTPAADTAYGCPFNSAAFPAAVGFVASGSGAGQAALFANDGTLTVSSIPLLGTLGGTPPFAAHDIQYALSDNAMAAADINSYLVGGAYQGITLNTGSSAPKAKFGPLVQVPVSIDPVDLAYNPAGLTGLGSAKLKLDAASYCAIYAGTLTDWNNSGLAILNGLSGSGSGTLTGGVSLPIKVVGRSDSSGTTSIFTRHLAAVCGSANWTTGATTLPNVSGITYDKQSGSAGVATEIAAVTGAIGYLGNDYIATAVNTAGLPAATLKNAHGDWVAPSGAAAAISFGSFPVPTGSDLADPTKWAQLPSDLLHMANSSATGAYPIVGTSNFLGYTCYASVNSVNSLRDLLEFAYTNPQILEDNGLAALPDTFASPWISTIVSTFLETDGTGTLFLAEAVTGHDGIDTTPDPQHVNTTCTASGVVGG